MNILHIAPNAPFNDDWGYQENILPKYQKKLGHNVILIITNTSHINGKIAEVPCDDYILKNGVRVIRLAHKKLPNKLLGSWHAHMEIFPYLNEIKPDFIFYHGLVSTTIFEAIKYKEKINPDCVIVQDNHLDYNIGNKFNTIKKKIVRSFYRAINRRSIPYISRVYGVTPWRKTYAEDYFKIPAQKTDVLIMGADDEKIDFEHKAEIRNKIRNQYGISENDFLVVTGGKIDFNKKIHLLMEAVKKLDNIKLLIFGQVSDDMKSEFDRLIKESCNIINIGWIEADRVYDYFFASDLVMFPGQHSVLWEQACASKVPCVFEKWIGMEHVNNGGNADFIDDISTESIAKKLNELKFTPKYYEMKQAAESEKTDIYLYSNIAKKSLECAGND